jgi:hypothetical protein
MSHLVDVSPFGARLRLSRPTEPGRLLHLRLAMPRRLRCFDYVEDQYRVWSLVRNVKLLPPSKKVKALMEVGVAFAGKRPPASFEKDPAQRYAVMEVTSETGLWTVREDASEELVEIADTEKRHETRHTIPVEVSIEVFGASGDLLVGEKTVTENISRWGAAVFTTMNIERGRFVKLTSEHLHVSAVAAVRARRTGSDGVPRLHLEFVGAEWPLER